MPTIRDGSLELTLVEDGSGATLRNLGTGVLWALDSDTVLGDGSGKSGVPFGPNRKRFGENAVDPDLDPAIGFDTGSVEKLGERALLVTRRGSAGQAKVSWELVSEGLRLTAISAESTVTACTLPGAFRPEGGGALQLAFPKNQGIWHRGRGAAFSLNMLRNGHNGWSMPFFAMVSTREALLTIIEDQHDARVWLQRTEDGRTRGCPVMDPSKGELGYDRSVLLRFVEPDLTAICSGYRQYVKKRGRLRTWEEKIAERPNLEKIFGALMCFIGYCQDDGTDYAAGFKQLREMGFERSYVYPMAIGNLVEGFEMGGRPPIDIRDQLGLLEELGYLAAGWMWTEDIPEEQADLLLNAGGEHRVGWQIGERKWYKACPQQQVAISERIQDQRMSGGFSAQHFDVTASRAGLECFHPDHPLDRRGDSSWRAKILETAARRGCVVSSEGFWDYASGSYDIGSAKLPVPVHEDWYAVPMTALVYHDSMIHDWWEVHNYNNPNHRNQFGSASVYFPQGGGWQELQAAVDALGGCPPNVMPFGAQYRYANDGLGTRETELYRYGMDMPEVKRALELALPVAELHRRIGKLACTGHQALAEDGSLQATEFSDGTRVVANFSDQPREAPGAGFLGPHAWKAS